MKANGSPPPLFETDDDKPQSRLQKYRLTDKGKEWVEQNQAEK